MYNNNFFSLRRFFLVSRKDISAGSRGIITTAAALFGTIVVITFLSGIHPAGVDVHTGIFTGFLFGGGFILSSLVFREMHSKERSHEWHMLPASSFEKFLSRMLLSSIGWIITFIVLYWAASSLGEAITRMVFGHGNPLFNPFTGYIWLMALHYVILQSIFLLGATYFRKTNFIKTILSLFVINTLLVLVGVLLLKLFFWNVFSWQIFSDGPSPMIGWMDWSLVATETEAFFQGFAGVMKVLYYGVLAPVLWLIAYFRVAEKEVRNGI